MFGEGSQAKDVFGCDETGSLGVESVPLECEDKPMVIDELYGGFSIVDRDLIRERIANALSLVPGCSALDVGWKIIVDPKGDWDERVVFRECEG